MPQYFPFKTFPTPPPSLMNSSRSNDKIKTSLMQALIVEKPACLLAVNLLSYVRYIECFADSYSAHGQDHILMKRHE